MRRALDLPAGVEVHRPDATGVPEIDAALRVLDANRDRWPEVDVSERLLLIDDASRRLMKRSDDWVSTSLRAKGFQPGTLAEAEEWLYLASIARALRMLRMSLRECRRRGKPRVPVLPRMSPDGRLVTRVVPRDRWDRVLFQGFTGDVWHEPGVGAGDMFRVPGTAATGRVCLVLGAGNASMLPVVDVLHRLFVENQVVILKPNPVNAYLGPLIEDVFQGFVRGGFLRVVYGGVAEGDYICRHPVVDELHLTGSSRTYDAIVFGPGSDGERRKAAGDPLLTKPFSGELGNISPVIVVPGPWSEADLRNQAEQIATWLVANAGFGCLTPRVIVQHAGWPLRTALVDAIGRVLEEVPTRPAYYPGAHEIHAAFLDAHPDARRIGMPEEDHLPWTLISGVDPANQADVCFTSEPFCSLMAETALEARDTVDYIRRAVSFANETLWGSLTATLLVHPASMRDPAIAAAVEDAIGELRYGTVLVNMAAFAAYYFMVTPWGAYPGHDIRDIQSGTGKTANFMFLNRPEKSVVRGPFRPRFNPVRITARRPHIFARRLARFEAAPSLARAAGTAWSGARPGRGSPVRR